MQSTHTSPISHAMARIAAPTTRQLATLRYLLRLAALAFAVMGSAQASPHAFPEKLMGVDAQTLGRQLEVGDIVFIHVPALPFKKIASATKSWTNHVGIVIDTAGPEPLIGESKIPVSTATPFSRFVARSEHGRVRVSRLANALSTEEKQAVTRSAQRRMGVIYDTGFNLNSGRQFCSRYVHEVVAEATGHPIGEVENFLSLLGRNPETDLSFWRLWFFGNIPWQRNTVTPASVMESPRLVTVFDGMLNMPSIVQAIPQRFYIQAFAR